MEIYCGKCGGAYDDQFVVCPHCGNIREEQQEKFAVEEIKPEPPKSKKKTPNWVKITAVVVAVVIVLTGVLWSTGTLGNIMPVQAGYVRVPSVIGKSREKAKDILTKEKLGLLIIGKMDTDDDMELGLVCEQSPGKGDKAKENADVSVMLSNGPKMGYMPATVYYKVDTATANIEAQGLKAEVKYEYSDEVGKDGVISQSVETNTAVKQGETVTITVSKGSKNESEGTVKMKNLVGMDFETARKELLKDGIYLLVEDAKYDDNAPENQIIVQNDKEGAEIQKGENVFVTISLGKKKVRVPDLVYLEKAEAESKLKELGFTVKTETGSDENTADGLVLEQSAPSGEMLEKGSEITITVNEILTENKKSDEKNNGLSYEMREEYFEKKTKSGILFISFKLNYPYFFGDSVVEKELNSRYTEMINKYKERMTNDIEDWYNSLVENNELDRLPFYNNTEVTVTYNDNGFISLFEWVHDWPGGAHPYHYENGITYEIETGRKMVYSDFFVGDENKVDYVINNKLNEVGNSHSSATYNYEKWYENSVFVLNQQGVCFYHWVGDAVSREEIIIPYTDGKAPYVYVN